MDLAKQITHITVDINIENVKISNRSLRKIFLHILRRNKCLCDFIFLLKFSEQDYMIPYFDIPNKSFLSSTLAKLTINVNTFSDCLLLLNGSLESLSILIIYINKIGRSLSIIDNTVSASTIVKYKQISFSNLMFV